MEGGRHSGAIKDSHTTLTPLMSKFCSSGNSNSKATSCEATTENLRRIVYDALQKQLYPSAIFFADKLTSLPSACTADQILYAKCFHASGEHRRCLVALEYRNLLSADNIVSLTNNMKAACLTEANNACLDAVKLAADCLFALEQYNDCLLLLEPLIHMDDITRDTIRTCQQIASNTFNMIAGLYCIAGQCYDITDNRPRAIRALLTAVRIDATLVEAVEYIARKGLLSEMSRKSLVSEMEEILVDESLWLLDYYRFVLLNEATDQFVAEAPNALVLVQNAEQLYANCQCHEAYKVARQAYIIDPYDWRGVTIYVACMVELGLKNELFYLGHELVETYPKHSVTWYTVGCYYWTCQKYEFAQKYLQRATKLDKRYANAWLALGHVLAAQEESENAISAYRTACRLLPGDHRPQTYMAKELIRTSNYSLALHVLSDALELCPTDPLTLNEFGVTYMSLSRLAEALPYLERAAETVMGRKTKYDAEIFSNFATCLRRMGRYTEALSWYYSCHALKPGDATTHAHIDRFDDAIDEYHKALSICPTMALCAELLGKVMQDKTNFDKATFTLPKEHSILAFMETGEEDAPSNSISHSAEDISGTWRDSPIPLQTSFSDMVDGGGFSSPVFGSSAMDLPSAPYSSRRRQSYFLSEEESMESYSRVAGRLSLDST